MIETALLIFVFLMTVVFHEVSHGLAAYALGDATAKEAGRLSLNPLRHIHLFWTLVLPALLFWVTGGRFMFGMARPVPVNFFRLRHFRRGMVLVALAGPAANLVIAGALAWVWKYLRLDFVLLIAYLNLGLAVFNLVPVPPLDGSRLAAAFLPLPWILRLFSLERLGILVILLLYWQGILLRFVLAGIHFFSRLYGLPPLVL